MKTVKLYIGDKVCDLGDDATILYNYESETLKNPTIVKNSFSQQLTLPDSPANNEIFGHYFNTTRVTMAADGHWTGRYFNALKKTPFRIVKNGSELIEEGYVRLDELTRSNGTSTYKITLFGGLGSFFFALKYDDEGNERSLADIDFGIDLGFTINRTAIKAAWENLRGAAPSLKWDNINFAPCYNGVPENFNAGVALATPKILGLLNNVIHEDGKDYRPVSGYAKVDLNKDYTEWMAHDMRSYNQRPVLRLGHLILALCNPEVNGGYSVELDPAFFNPSNKYWTDTWLTLPMLSKIKKETTASERHNQRSASTADTDWDPNLEFSYGWNVEDVSPNGNVKITCNDIKPVLKLTYPEANGNTLIMKGGYNDGIRCIFLQLTGEDSGGNIICGSQVVSLVGEQGASTADYAERAGFTPWYNSDSGDIYGASYYGEFLCDGTQYPTWHRNGSNPVLEIESRNVVHYTLRAKWGCVNWESAQKLFPLVPTDPPSGHTLSMSGFQTEVDEVCVTSDVVRSGVEVTQEELLSGTKSPADYLLSYCKLFGLYFLKEKNSKTIKILARDTFYENYVVDLTDAIDRDKDIQTIPFVFDSHWYDLGLENDGGLFADLYSKKHKRRFGLQRINTGYEFNADHKELLEGNAFKGACEVKEQSKYNMFLGLQFNPERTMQFIPSVAFLDGGQKFEFMSADGETIERNCPQILESTSKFYFDDVFKGYDKYSRVQLHGEDDKAIDGEDVLLFFRGMTGAFDYSSFALTDDNASMNVWSPDKPCWILPDANDSNLFGFMIGIDVRMPLFGRYIWDGQTVDKSLDMGTPFELDMPEVVCPEEASIYDQYWKKYIADRYDVDSRVLSAYVDMRRLGQFGPVSEQAFRRFYRIDSALFVLNKIMQYDVDEDGFTKCEFVKVKSKDDYIHREEQWLNIPVTSIHLTEPIAIVPLEYALSSTPGKTFSVEIENDYYGLHVILDNSQGHQYVASSGSPSGAVPGGEYTITLTALKNFSTEQKSCAVVFRGEDGQEIKRIAVTQEGFDFVEWNLPDVIDASEQRRVDAVMKFPYPGFGAIWSDVTGIPYGSGLEVGISYGDEEEDTYRRREGIVSAIVSEPLEPGVAVEATITITIHYNEHVLPMSRKVIFRG